MAIMLIKFRPLDSSFNNKLELVNEFTTIVLLYVLYAFTNLIVDEEVRNKFGPVYIGISLANILVHLCI